MGEIGNFSAFSKPKQLFAYFDLDPAVKQSGKFESTKTHMSKRDSAIARRVVHTLALQSSGTSRMEEDKNPVLRNYYLKKCELKPKLVNSRPYTRGDWTAQRVNWKKAISILAPTPGATCSLVANHFDGSISILAPTPGATNRLHHPCGGRHISILAPTPGAT